MLSYQQLMRLTKLGLLLLVAAIFTLPSPAHASFYDDFINKSKEILGFKPQPPSVTPGLKVESNIVLAKDGDLNNNNEIDSGDTVTFSYKITNPTNNLISFATLETKINKSNLNYIRNITGTPNLSNQNKTITIPNLRVNPNQTLLITFDATINYFNDNDKFISTEANLLSSDKKELGRDSMKEVRVKLSKDIKIRSNLNTRKN